MQKQNGRTNREPEEKKNAEHKNFVNFNVLAGAATAKRQCFILSNGMRCDVNS